MQSEQQNSRPIVISDSGTRNGSPLTNIRNMTATGISDRELGRRVRHMFGESSITGSSYPDRLFGPFDFGFGSFGGFSSRMNQLWKNMHDELAHVDELDDFDVEGTTDGSDSKSGIQSNAYTKYTSSVTSYGTDGVRKSKTVSGVEKMKNGKRSVHTKMVTQTGSDMTIEEMLPNGDKKTTTRKVEGKAIEDK